MRLADYIEQHSDSIGHAQAFAAIQLPGLGRHDGLARQICPDTAGSKKAVEKRPAAPFIRP